MEAGGEGEVKAALPGDLCGNLKQALACRVSAAFMESVNGENRAEKRS